MRKIMVLIMLLISTLLLISCNNQIKDDRQPFDPMESSIFKIAEVKNARALEDLEVKAGASESYSTITTLKKGDIVRVLASIDDWYVIRLENYQIGCIDSRKTEAVVLPGTPQAAQEENPVENTESKPTENLPGQVDHENQLINLINQERTKNGLPALVKDSQLTRVARIKAQDMTDNNYFSHNSPTYGNPFDMMDEFDIEYQYAGENLAKNTSATKAHTALMNSSGHRKNILNPNFTHVGVGVKKAEQGYIYVEMFIGVPQ